MKAVFERGFCFDGKGGECHAAVILAFANANLMDVQVRLFARFWTMVVISDVRPWNLLEQKFVKKITWWYKSWKMSPLKIVFHSQMTKQAHTEHE